MKDERAHRKMTMMTMCKSASMVAGIYAVGLAIAGPCAVLSAGSHGITSSHAPCFAVHALAMEKSAKEEEKADLLLQDSSKEDQALPQDSTQMKQDQVKQSQPNQNEGKQDQLMQDQMMQDQMMQDQMGVVSNSKGYFSGFFDLFSVFNCRAEEEGEAPPRKVCTPPSRKAEKGELKIVDELEPQPVDQLKLVDDLKFVHDLKLVDDLKQPVDELKLDVDELVHDDLVHDELVHPQVHPQAALYMKVLKHAVYLLTTKMQKNLEKLGRVDGKSFTLQNLFGVYPPKRTWSNEANLPEMRYMVL
jgi:hypothetical protein